MKKLAIAAAIAAVSSLAQAANFVSVDMDRVTDTKSKVQSTAQIVRAGFFTAFLSLSTSGSRLFLLLISSIVFSAEISGGTIFSSALLLLSVG